MISKRVIGIEPTVLECDTAEETNQLYSTGEWQKPRYSDKRDKYILIRLTPKVRDQ